jgi:hypothetical protein
MYSIKKLAAAFAAVALTTVLVSCGGGGDGGVDSTADNLATADKGTVTLLVTDGPTDDFKEINLTILKAELLCDSGNQELFAGEKEFDLLQLTNVTEIFSVSEVTTGFCSKIRLKLKQIELVFKDPAKDSVLAKLLGNGKLDLKPESDFYVGPDDPLYVQLDFDAKKSIQIKSKSKYNFRPVVFIKVVKDKFDTKLIRQRGTIENLDYYSEAFDLCPIEAEGQPVSDDKDDDYSDCVRVNTTDAPASIFDDLADPITFMELAEGQIATVVGRLSFHHSKSDDDSSDDSSFDDDSSDDRSSDDSSSDDDSSDDNDRPDLELAAEVIWTGNKIAQTTNIACSGVTTDDDGTSFENFELPLPENGCVLPGGVRTDLQPGAKIYDSEGNEVDESSIAEGILNQVDAYADADSEPPVNPKAVLVMLGLDEALNPLDQLIGTISDVDIDFANETSSLTLVLDTGPGDRCVNFDNVETQVFETSIDENNRVSFEQKSVFSLSENQKADVFGTELNGCLNAEIIIYEDEEAEIAPI